MTQRKIALSEGCWLYGNCGTPLREVGRVEETSEHWRLGEKSWNQVDAELLRKPAGRDFEGIWNAKVTSKRFNFKSGSRRNRQKVHQTGHDIPTRQQIYHTASDRQQETYAFEKEDHLQIFAGINQRVMRRLYVHQLKERTGCPESKQKSNIIHFTETGTENIRKMWNQNGHRLTRLAVQWIGTGSAIEKIISKLIGFFKGKQWGSVKNRTQKGRCNGGNAGGGVSNFFRLL